MTQPRRRPLVRPLAHVGRHTGGATMIEFTIVVWVLLTITFGIVEFGIALWQYNSTVAAANLGVREAVQSDPVAPVLTTYNAVTRKNNPLQPGESLDLPNFTIRCVAQACTCADGNCSDLGDLGYDAAAFGVIANRMRTLLPFLTQEELNERLFVEYNHIGLGFAGRPGPDIVPIVSVGLTNHTYEFILMTAFGFDQWPIATGRATLPAEDLSTSWPP